MSSMLLQLTADPRSPHTEPCSVEWPCVAKKKSHVPDCKQENRDSGYVLDMAGVQGKPIYSNNTKADPLKC